MEEKLTHLVYDASLDNSLWPELILELCEQLQLYRDGRLIGDQPQDLDDLARHFQRAFAISERMVDLQERSSTLLTVLNSFSFGVALLNDRGDVILANNAIEDQLFQTTLSLAAPLDPNAQETAQRPLSHWITQSNALSQSLALKHTPSSAGDLLMLPRHEAMKLGFPASAAAVLMSVQKDVTSALAGFSNTHGLTSRETETVKTLIQCGDLRDAAAHMGITYESARSYLKRIYQKTGCSSQSALVQKITQSPLNLLKSSRPAQSDLMQVRRLLRLPDDRQIEYFCLGSDTGYPVVSFDALAGATIDVLGYPQNCLRFLEKYNIRLIIPCRPGGFRSDLKVFKSLRDFAPDVCAILEREGIGRFSIFGLSFGANSALGVAHELQRRVDRLVLSSPSYPLYQHPNWRELDQFYVLWGVLGRHWPSMLRRIIPFLVRSILQNRDRYFDRYCARTKSQHDIEVLSHPTIRRRTAELLAERTVQGTDGIVEENLLNIGGWDFDVGDIAVPVEIFHGELDNVAPIEGSETLVRHLPVAALHRLPGKGHYHHMIHWPSLVARAAGHDVAPDNDRYGFPDAP
jgi:pimeloyl-ACP methyl ester carboxylesterase/DNA-binding CsgD family transcriptional regulator